MKLSLALLLLSSSAFAGFVVPPLPHPVNDYANVLTPHGKEVIAQQVVELKKATGAQLGVLLVNTLDGDPLEESSMAVARAWRLGSAANDDGILLFVVVKDRKSRIEVGQGLEGVVTDVHARRILATMRSSLRAGNFDAAIGTGVAGIYSRIKDNAADIQKGPVKSESSHGAFFVVLLIILVLGAVGFGLISYFKRKERENELKKALEKDRQKAYWDEQRMLASQRNARMVARAEERVLTNKTIAAPAYVPIPTVDDEEERRRVRRRREEREAEEESSRRRRNDDSYSSYSSYSSSSSSDSSSSGSSWGGGGGDFSGGGSSDSW